MIKRNGSIHASVLGLAFYINTCIEFTDIKLAVG
jgi:hypothetical protein